MPQLPFDYRAGRPQLRTVFKFWAAQRGPGLCRSVAREQGSGAAPRQVRKPAATILACSRWCVREAAPRSFLLPTASWQRRDTLPRLNNSSCATRPHHGRFEWLLCRLDQNLF